MRREHFMAGAGGVRRLGPGLLVLLSFCALNVMGQTTVTNAPAIAPAASGLPDTGTAVLRVFGALALVTGIFLGGVWLFRNWQRLAVRKGGTPKLNVMEVKSLGQRQALFVVGYEQQRMLVATSPAGVTLLSHLPAAEDGETVNAVAPRVSFIEAFQHVLNRKG